MDRKVWQEPKKEHSLDEAQTPLWFWNDELKTEELLRQLKMQTEIGVTCTNPHARRNNGEGYIGGYLDEKWFQDIKTVLDYKKEHGEKMWLYDEIDWPAGTCDQTITLDERNREKYITIKTVEIPAGQVFRAQLKRFEGGGLFGVGPETDKSALTWNIHVIDAETFEEYPTEEHLIYDRFGPEFEFSADRDCIAFITKVNADLYDHGGNGQVSYLNPKATEQFLESTYDKYYERFGEDFGKTITTVFNDETRMAHAIAWSDEFAETFLEQKGYDIRNELYRIILPGEQAGRVRCDYFDVLAYLYQHNYFGVIHDWCEKHGLKLFAHLLAEETLFGHARYSGDYLRQNRFQDVCGADHLGKGIGSLNIKFTACGAHSYGKKRTAVEVFAGCGWDMTFEEYTRIITWMFQMGMQTIINHGFFYSDRGNRKNDWPPSQFFQWKGWPRQSEGNDMIRRLNYSMTDGINEADILVYLPIESFWLDYLPDQNFTHGFFHGAFLRDGNAVETDRQIQLLLNGLLSENLDFDLLHRDAAENFEILLSDAGAESKAKENDREENPKERNGARIRNRLSGQVFSVLVLPMCEVLPIEAARLAEDFAEAGGKIAVVEKRPRLALDRRDDEELAGIVERLYASGQAREFSAQEKDELFAYLEENTPCPVKIVEGCKRTENNHSAYPAYLIDPYMHGGEDLSGVMFTRYLKDEKRNTLFMNYGGSPETIEVLLRTGAEKPEVWDTFTGEIKEAEVLEKLPDGYRIRLTLPCNYGVVVVSGR
ncbi:MAG TPA: hypothetical protein H9695_16555 [Candidatus Mediterraneibacter excrementigallinarum]|nr:hypothetical protein [Candidatus Mediterraneibacter excrementigallinarum]